MMYYNVHYGYAVGWGTLSLLNAGLAQAQGRSGLFWGCRLTIGFGFGNIIDGVAVAGLRLGARGFLCVEICRLQRRRRCVDGKKRCHCRQGRAWLLAIRRHPRG